AVREAGAPVAGRRLAQRAIGIRRDRARVRLRPVLHPAALRGPRPHRPAPHRGRARPRGKPVRGISARHTPALHTRDPRGRGADRTADVRRLLHERPDLGVAANDDDRQPDRRVHAAGLPEDGGRRPYDAARALPPGAGVVLPAPDPQGRPRASALMAWLRNPWGRPRFLPLIAAIYIFWSIVPVVIAIVFAFNSSRSRTSWDGFSLRWFYSDPDLSVWNDPALQGALKHTLVLAVICVAIATPLGVALALGLQRWRGRGCGSVNVLMLLPLVTPEIVMGVALLLLFLQVFSAIGIGTTTQAIGQITLTIA